MNNTDQSSATSNLGTLLAAGDLSLSLACFLLDSFLVLMASLSSATPPPPAGVFSNDVKYILRDFQSLLFLTLSTTPSPSWVFKKGKLQY